ncbi:hypothetical protein PISMIDRAFT_350512 [Pisolithus microcarpus 441]|uniref:Uncharacterized protein n=1 Tax=Pisolithus microcarpus 441 TaxID=765257 RepID=A0A0C9YWL8_9AGAM|nr:hypothetical protein PISMIDRAFT_350512 [Pisolithus microcarpus 441]
MNGVATSNKSHACEQGRVAMPEYETLAFLSPAQEWTVQSSRLELRTSSKRGGWLRRWNNVSRAVPYKYCPYIQETHSQFALLFLACISMNAYDYLRYD